MVKSFLNVSDLLGSVWIELSSALRFSAFFNGSTLSDFSVLTFSSLTPCRGTAPEVTAEN